MNIIPHWISVVTFLPLIGAFAVLLMPSRENGRYGPAAMVVTILTFIASLPLFFWYSPAASAGQFQFVDYHSWISSPVVSYFLGIDGISLLMILMTTAIFPFVVGSSLKSITEKTKMFYFLILLMETAILGVFDSLNLLLFYVFYEAMLIPLYFVIGIWGGPKRVYASMKFFLYTMVGSMLMLVAIIGIYFLTGTFDFPSAVSILPQVLAQKYGDHASAVEMLLFLGFFAAFAVKAPIWPFHTWVPDAYAEAPTGGSIILVALKMGLYGFVRFCIPLFPHATVAAAPVIVVLGVIGVVYAAIVAAIQTDLKRLIAYSSISHVGVIVLAIFGLTAIGISGGVVQMVSHTITTGALFILIGILFARRGSYDINAYGGVWKVMPVFSSIFLLATLSSVALPGTAGFTGEFLMLVGSFQSQPWAAGFATTAAIFSVVYMLWMFQRVMYGKTEKPEILAFTDLTRGEMWALVPLVALIIWIGIYPPTLLDKLNPSVTRLLSGASLQMKGRDPADVIPESMGTISLARPSATSRTIVQ
jgi:NADH-quinone oxidoreductase subunit M